MKHQCVAENFPTGERLPRNANAAQSGRGGGAAKKTIRDNNRPSAYRPRLHLLQAGGSR